MRIFTKTSVTQLYWLSFTNEEGTYIKVQFESEEDKLDFERACNSDETDELQIRKVTRM